MATGGRAVTTERRNRNSVLFLRPDELKGLIRMEEAIEAVDQGYREAAAFPVVNAPRRRVHSPDGVRVSNFPGGIPGMGVIGSMTRAETVELEAANQDYGYREHPVYLLWDSKTAQLLSVMMGEISDERIGFSSLMALRTAATTAVGVKHLARSDATVMGLFGSGGQALNKVLAIKAVRDIKRLKVFGRDPERRRAFCGKVTRLCDLEAVPVDGPEEVVKDADLVISATNSNVPVFDGRLLEPGQHVATIVGSNTQLVEGGFIKKGRRENDDETVRRADVIVTNWVESVISEKQCGLWDPMEAGIITREQIIGLGDVASGKHPGRTTREQITYHFNNNGTAAADLAIAKVVYDRAMKEGRGLELEIALPGQQ
jgi:ornithine cyclodeaminase/alanine dehydrogenase-like protein (mu-crystallin family)